MESVLSAMILGIALGACVMSFSMAMRGVNAAGNQMVALHIARNELETLRVSNFSNAVFDSGSHVFTNTGMAGTYVVTNINSATKNITVNVPYVNHIHGGYSTNTLVTSIVSTLH
jgi:type II secretory pathway pseudopilin PulG